MDISKNLFKNFDGVILIKIDGQTVFKNKFCKLNGEDTSCKKSGGSHLKLKLEKESD